MIQDAARAKYFSRFVFSLTLATLACKESPLLTAPMDGVPNVSTARQAPKGIQYASLAAATQTMCGLSRTGQGYCWGLNNYGQLGDGSNDFFASTPRLIAGGHRFSQIAHRYQHGCGIEQGVLYCWGLNDKGQLGNPSITTSSRVPVPVDGSFRFKEVAVGLFHTCGIATEQGVVPTLSNAGNNGFCWGWNQYGQIGNNLFGGDQRETTPQPIHHGTVSGVDVPTAHGLQLYWIEASGLATCALSEGTDLSGRPTGSPEYVICWGLNDLGIFENQFNLAQVPRPAIPSLYAPSVELSLFLQTACAMATTGAALSPNAYCWGSNYAGQVGDNSTITRANPTSVFGPALTKVSSGPAHSCGIAEGGQAYCWGANNRGQLGTGTLASSLVPVPVAGGIRFKEIYAAGANPHVSFTCGLTALGDAWCWGANEVGELGDGTTVDRHVPTQVLGPA